MEVTPNSAVNKEFQVTGVSRSGRVRKKSSKLLDFQSPDEVEKKLKRAPKTQPRNGAMRGRPQLMGNRTPVRKALLLDGVTVSSDIVNNIAVDDDDLLDDIDLNVAGDSEQYDDDCVEDIEPTGDSDEDLKQLVAGIVDGESVDNGGNLDSKVRSSLYMTEKTNKRRVLKDGRIVTGKPERKDKGKTRYTAYSMWARELRKTGKLGKSPDLDFSTSNKRLGEMWANVSNKEKDAWRRKAKLQANRAKTRERALGAGVNNYSNSVSSTPMSYFKPTTSRTTKLVTEPQKSPISSTSAAVRPRTQRSSIMMPSTTNTGPDATSLVPKRKRNNSHNRLNTSGVTNNVPLGTASGAMLGSNNLTKNNNFLNNSHNTSTYANTHGAHKKTSLPGIEPIDAAAHLKLLGESLTIIGEGLKEHEGQIAVSGSLSVLLDSLLCSLGPLLCLTTRIPGLENNAELNANLASTLDNIAYVMPGL